MRRTLWLLTLAGCFLVAPRTAEAASTPNIEGDILGIELAPQSIAGAAIFTGIFDGTVGKNTHTFGYFVIAVKHDPLPDAGEFANLKGGVWELGASRKRFRGIVTQGTLYNNGDNTFLVAATLEFGGMGTLTFVGVLNHKTLIPTITGSLSP
jgi:hypothetical protein